jgi:hypothetical protein
MLIREGRPFPAAYVASELDEFPAGADVVELNPGKQGGSGGLIFEVDPESCALRVGFARPSAMGARDAISGLVATPNANRLCVLARGTAYLVDADHHSYRAVSMYAPVTAAAPVLAAGVLLLGRPWLVIGIGQDGVIWRTGRLAIDGLTAR